MQDGEGTKEENGSRSFSESIYEQGFRDGLGDAAMNYLARGCPVEAVSAIFPEFSKDEIAGLKARAFNSDGSLSAEAKNVMAEFDRLAALETEEGAVARLREGYCGAGLRGFVEGLREIARVRKDKKIANMLDFFLRGYALLGRGQSCNGLGTHPDLRAARRWPGGGVLALRRWGRGRGSKRGRAALAYWKAAISAI